MRSEDTCNLINFYYLQHWSDTLKMCVRWSMENEQKKRQTPVGTAPEEKSPEKDELLTQKPVPLNNKLLFK